VFKSLLFILLPLAVFAQENIIIRAKIVDEQSGQALAYANLKLTDDSKKIKGAQTDENGQISLEIKPGKYVFEWTYLAYKTKIEEKKILVETDLGLIKLEPSNQVLNELTVTAEKSSTELSLDKRVFNVGKDLATAGGSALDILVNVPAVSVDPDGALKLRGNSNVRILIDGKPSGMVSFKGGAGLRQLQASMIERVEVITNPSARYEAEGQAGIINIILKKDNKQGLNGSFELISGFPTNLGVAANLNYRKKKLNFFLNYNLAYRGNPYVGDLYQEVTEGNSKSILVQESTGKVFGFDNNIRGGLEYYFSEKNVLTTSYLFTRAGGNRYTENNYKDYDGSLSRPVREIVRIQEEVEKEPISEYVLSYKRSFNRKGHELQAQFRFLDHFENSDQVFSQTAKLASGETDLKNTLVQTSVNDEFEKHYLLQLDYTQPFSKVGKFELGLRSSVRDMVNDFVVSDLDKNGKEIAIPEFNNYFVYGENIQALYGIISNKYQRFSYQAGLRYEYTDVLTELKKTAELNPRKYANVFPSTHLSFVLDKNNTLQTSYSRRLKRPVYNDLSPFMTLSDSRNFFSGNPNLNPEYSDIVEIGHLATLGNSTLTSSVYFRYTDDFIFNIRRVNAEGFSTSLPENLLSEKAYGLDLTGNFSLKKWWKLDANFNLFHAAYDGSNIDTRYAAETNTWFFRQTSRFILAKAWELQVRANYDAAQKTAQGSRKGIFFTDLSIRKSLWNKKGSLNFSVLDVFNSRWTRMKIVGENFYTERNSLFRPRQINLTLSYRLRN
jgi:ferric enterobactin receptor